MEPQEVSLCMLMVVISSTVLLSIIYLVYLLIYFSDCRAAVIIACSLECFVMLV